MAFTRALIISLVLVGFTHGVGDLIGDGLHLLLEGRWVHCEEHRDHAAGDEEHGCSGWDHKCSCHSSSSFLNVTLPVIPAASAVSLAMPMAALPGAPDVPTSPLERPPRV